MRPHIAQLLRDFGNLFFDTAERIHPIDNQPMAYRSVPLTSEQTAVIIAALNADLGRKVGLGFQRPYDQN